MTAFSPREYIERQLSRTPSRIQQWTRINNNEKPHRRIFNTLSHSVKQFLTGNSYKNILIVPGLRGIGKTTVLFQLLDKFRNHLAEERTICLTCDDISAFELDLAEILDAYETYFLQKHLEELGETEKVLVFLDEAHYAKDWPVTVKSYADRSDNILFVITGSSALSLELTTDLARRKEQHNILPLTFPEYIEITHSLDGGKAIRPQSGTLSQISKALLQDLTPNRRIELLHNGLSRLRTRYFSQVSPKQAKLENFLIYGGFPFHLRSPKEFIHDDVLEICNRVTDEDLPLISDVGKTGKVASKGLKTLQLISSDPTLSLRRIADSIGNISQESVSNLLEGYEKSGLIQKIRPYGSTKTITRKSNEYYFASPTLQAAMWESLGQLNTSNEKIGKLWETYTANLFAKMKQGRSEIDDLYYSYKEGEADFIIKLQGGKLVPVEIGWGTKDVRQVLNTLVRIHGSYGLVISDHGESHKQVKDNGELFDVFFIPKEALLVF